MTHEFKQILSNVIEAQKLGLKTVMATVVALDGSSYRKPGVRMLIREDGQMTGAVSGGCVEKEVLRQCREVFESNQSKIMCYDGRYRLGCEGSLYILLEPFDPSADFINAFNLCLKSRKAFDIFSYFSKEEGLLPDGGSIIHFKDQPRYRFSNKSIDTKTLQCFSEEMKPCFKLLIIGAEHDAVQLCTYAALTGWEVTIIASLKDPKTAEHFPGAKELLHLSPEEVNGLQIDNQTAIVLMSHNYATDLQYLVRLKNSPAIYIGILGPVKRREDLLDEIVLHHPDVDPDWLDRIHGPAGLNIGSVTPQEIAISIVSEILTITREEKPMSLRDKSGAIHKAIIN